MQYTINELRHKIFKPVFDVYEVFENFFGEPYVDLQGLPPDEHLLPDDISMEALPSYDIDDSLLAGLIWRQRNIKPFIFVWWPSVKVTNENDKSVIIQDLYAKIELNVYGQIPTENRGFKLNRATYSIEQWSSSYLHSHIQSIPKHNLEHFMDPCLGTGPIIGAISSLKEAISEEFDEVRWMLFCQELSQYVQVESLAGVPYKYLENICVSDQLREFSGYTNKKEGMFGAVTSFYRVFNKAFLKDFILYYLKEGHLSIGYRNNTFITTMPYFDYIIDVSNAFIEFFNSNPSIGCIGDGNVQRIIKDAFSWRILYKAVAVNGKFCRENSSCNTSGIEDYIGKKVCTFKGAEIKLNIISNIAEFTPQTTIIMNNNLAMFILNNILRTINYHYANEHTRQQDSTALPCTTSQNAYYL